MMPLASWTLFSPQAMDDLLRSVAAGEDWHAMAGTALLVIALWGFGVLVLDTLLWGRGTRRGRGPRA